MTITQKLTAKKAQAEKAISDFEMRFVYQGKIGTFGQKQKAGIARVELVQRSTGFYRSANNLDWVLNASPEMMFAEAVSNFQ